MSEPLAYLNGWVPAAQAVVPVYDAGFIQGATVSEQLRTFGGDCFALDRHLARLARSLEIVGIDAGLSIDELGTIATELATHNYRLLAAGDDLGLSMFVTPGLMRRWRRGRRPVRRSACTRTHFHSALERQVRARRKRSSSPTFARCRTRAGLPS